VWDYPVIHPTQKREASAANLAKHHHLSLSKRHLLAISAIRVRHASRETRMNRVRRVANTEVIGPRVKHGNNGDHVSKRKRAINVVNLAGLNNNHLKTTLAVRLRYRKTRLRLLFVES
jgi:hypothetical protein